MLLTKIKLAGFKSFVDPTTLVVPGNLVGIVGPNGCGKSNIIDAVTWVMGESSAKHLRGDSLTDVIFNGSGARQPVGQASVELVFDNSSGKLGGQYGSYNEISIKRQINREGISTYYLNGSRCRRRDIQGIFLGTGLGPRSYAIIEQGVISRLIEARPEELRTFIEEAAGISKYRERRRETENRIRHTRENIERLEDIREELGKQLNHLKRQARAAERYQVLKQEERQLKAELLALNWKGLNGQARKNAEQVEAQQTRVEAGVAKLRRVEVEIEKHRDEQTGANEALSEAQSIFYRIGGEISQLEQKIQHTQERIGALEADLVSTEETVASARSEQESDKAQLAALFEKGHQLEPRLKGSRDQSNQAYDTLNSAEQAMQSWQSEWDACNETTANFSRQIEVDTTRLEHLEASIEELKDREQAHIRELEGIDLSAMASQLADLEKQLSQQGAAIDAGRGSLEEKQAGIRHLRDEIRTINDALTKKRADYQALTGKIAALEALQQDAAGNNQEATSEWLTATGLGKAPRLAQQLVVEPEWAPALETVLGQRLQDICVDDLKQMADSLASLKQGQVGMVSGAASQLAWESTQYERLIDKVSSKLPLEQYLAGIYVAPDLDKAFAMRAQLQVHESIVTIDGIWLGPNWIRINRQEDAESGILSRERQINALKERESVIAEEIQALESSLTSQTAALESAEQALHTFQDELHPEQEVLAQLHSQYAGLKTRIEESDKRKAQLQEALDELQDQQQEDNEEIARIRQRLARTELDREELNAQRSKLNALREHHRQTLEGARTQWQSTHEQSHEIALQLESISSQRASIEQAIQRTEIQLSNLSARQQELEAALASNKTPIAEYEASLADKLAQRIRAEKGLTEARDHMQAIESALRVKEQERAESEQHVQALREQLEGIKMKAQETTVRLQTVQEQLQASGHQVEDILANLDENAELDTWQAQIEGVERKINRLGPINLAAIDEFNQLSERKAYLDSQHDDLSEALSTLENAIKKIDRETRTRFKETFDQLNSNLQAMFPVLFGGGHAYLELTGDDLLETGVTIMARPPGKRNSTIHLLSGGEKALTAVALVFAIFKLNPAPFCILDEVDAPLDDTNVGRFSQLVAEMSADIQFIFITHNKITMEIANQLLGVTMHEAGVSRLVTVDMDEAVEMAATA